MEVTQHAKYTCTFCGKVTVRRHSTGIWNCKSCKRTVAGGAYVVSCVRPYLSPRNWFLGEDVLIRSGNTNMLIVPPLPPLPARPCDV
jgi:large subunit ribosomal protein L37Ae